MNNTFALNGNGVNNKNANKIKKQKQYKKLKKELRKSTSITPTSTHTNIATDPTSFLTPPSLPTTLVLPIVQLSPTPAPPALIPESNNVNYTEPVVNHDNQTYESKGISAASIVGSDTSSQTPASVKTVHIVGPIIGIFAGIAFIAAAMFLIARNRKKRNLTTNQNDNSGNDDNTFHNISLDDEAITMPPLALDEKKRSFISTTTDYHSMAETLIGSRTNSVTKKQDSWQSSTISPTSTLVGHHASFLMVAERQQLQHEKPNLLDHFFKGMPIETYKAQLADILGPEEEELPVLNQPLPFISITDLSDYYK
ncbi:hypothetical protein MFLAVUS_008422 [Mucor flavus]|uniref:Uncharacterized protein n=1 Tax=Mucor flavus TaxID=439312 RepID=A0ABP9Z770_9FUNG